jgi:hypothetical protein
MLVAQALDEDDRGADVMCRVFLERASIGVCPTRLSANGKSYDKKDIDAIVFRCRGSTRDVVRLTSR